MRTYFDQLPIKFALLLGFVQGLAWVILSVACILVYFTSGTYFRKNSYMDIVNYCMFLYLFNDDETYFTTRTINKNIFFLFMIIHLILNVTWFFTSAYMHVKLRRVGKKLALWSYLTIVVSVWDVINVIIFGIDYDKCLRPLPAGVGSEIICANGILPVLVIAARGFTLWFLNVFFAVLVYNTSQSLPTGLQNIAPNSGYWSNNAAWYGQQQVVRPEGLFLSNVPYVPSPLLMQQTPAAAPPRPPNFLKPSNYPYIPDPDYNDVSPRRHF